MKTMCSRHMTIPWRIITMIFLATACIATRPANAQEHQLRLAMTKNEKMTTATVPVYLTSDSAITLIQFTVEFDSTNLQPLLPTVELGSQAGHLSISIVNFKLPFPPIHKVANKNLLVQLSGNGSESVTGDSLEIAKLSFSVTGSYGDSLNIWFDDTFGRTALTTVNLTDLRDETLDLQDGAVLVRDLTRPTSQILSPGAGATIGGTQTIVTGSATDGAGTGVTLVEVSVDSGKSWQPTQNTGAGFSQWQFVWSGYTAGNYTLLSRATDAAGNVEQVLTPISVTVSLSAPSVLSVTPISRFAKAAELLITLVFEDNGGGMNNAISPEVNFKPHGSISIFPVVQQSYLSSTWIGKATITSGMANGIATISVAGAQNNHGNTMTPIDTADQFIIDTTMPTVTDIQVQPRVSGPGIVQASITFADSISGVPGTIALYLEFVLANNTRILLSRTAYDSVNSVWSGSAVVTTDHFSGPARLRALGIEDRAGNGLSEFLSQPILLVDTTPPEVFDLLSPSDSSWENIKRPLFKWSSSSDLHTGLQGYRLFIDHILQSGDIAATTTAAMPGSDLEDGEHGWRVVAFDSVNNERGASHAFLISIDTTPPVTEITSLTPGASISGDSVIVEGTASDNDGIGVDSVLVSTDGGNTWNPAVSAAPNFRQWRFIWKGFVNDSYSVTSKAIDKLGQGGVPSEPIIVTDITKPQNTIIPTAYALSQNYPNPFNPETTIEFALPQAVHVQISIVNLLGQKIRTLADEPMPAGFKTVRWDGRDEAGQPASSGVYLYHLQAGAFAATRKLVLMR